MLSCPSDLFERGRTATRGHRMLVGVAIRTNEYFLPLAFSLASFLVGKLADGLPYPRLIGHQVMGTCTTGFWQCVHVCPLARLSFAPYLPAILRQARLNSASHIASHVEAPCASVYFECVLIVLSRQSRTLRHLWTARLFLLSGLGSRSNCTKDETMRA